MENNNFIVYCHTTPSGKKYIGLTGQKPEKRWLKGLGYRGQSYFYNAIEKYGWDNIKHEVLFEGLTREEACSKEIELIAKYDTTNRKKGYNQTYGGDHQQFTEDALKRMAMSQKKRFKEHPVTQETIEKIRKASKGRVTWNKGIKMPKEYCERLSQIQKGRKVTDITRDKISKALTGKSLSEEHRKKLSLAKKGKPSHRKGYKFTPKEIERSKIAHKGQNMGHPTSPETREKIRKALTGRKLSPERIAKMSEYRKGIKQSREVVEKRKIGMHKYYLENGIKVRCVELDTIYPTVSEAAKELNLLKANIYKVLHGERNITGGYHWEYVDPELKAKYPPRINKCNHSIKPRRVRCVETGVEYNSIREAGRIIGINRNSICNCLSGCSQTAAGYHWEYVDKE